MKSKPAPIDYAAARLLDLATTDDEKILATRTHTVEMKLSPEWAAATDVQTQTAAWNAQADALEANASVISGLRTKLAVCEGTQRVLRRKWRTSASCLLSTVTTYCAGSKDRVRAFTFDVSSHARLGALPIPTGLHAVAGKVAGEAIAAWLRGPCRHGFMTQTATDPANEATWTAPIPWTKTRLKLEGLTSGAIVHVRIAAIDPTSKTGQTDWTAWVALTVR